MKSEFQFLDDLKNKRQISKIGDDCAVLPKDSKTDLVITTDLLIEDIDFKRHWIKPKFLGHKALAVSLSDIAAMGAKPVWSMISIGVPESIWKTDFVDKFYNGYLQLAENFQVELIGGDISKTPEKIIIDSIAVGEIKKGKSVLRSGAEPNDLIFVTGELGGAKGGLSLLESGLTYDNSNRIWQKKLLDRQLKPSPQNGQIYAEFAASMIDLSDGLSTDLSHICRQSQVGAKIYAEKIPYNKNLKKISTKDSDILDFALNGGEDFELLFTVRPKNYKRISKKFSGEITHLGEITENIETIELIINEKSQILAPEGYSHF